MQYSVLIANAGGRGPRCGDAGGRRGAGLWCRCTGSHGAAAVADVTAPASAGQIDSLLDCMSDMLLQTHCGDTQYLGTPTFAL